MRGLGYRLTDVLVVAACSLTFVAVASPSRHEPKGPPIRLIAQDLGMTPEHFQQVAERIVPRDKGPSHCIAIWSSSASGRSACR